MALPLARANLGRLSSYSTRQWMLRSVIASMGQPSGPRRSIRSGRRAISQPLQKLHRIADTSDFPEHPLNDINEYEQGQLRNETTTATSEALSFVTTPSPDDSEPAPFDKPNEATGSDPSVPWYLQLEHRNRPPQQVESPMAARQRIPDLPEHPPPILAPILQHISVELGMDDLSLLDLRSLEPPPALGANLLMIIGTARSEKHLHVSADRLCRYLRTNFKLSPIADGLLGRNELKLKLRRRAKRTKMMTAAGVSRTADTEIDEGIRTGWICVNIGRVEGGELPEQAARRKERESRIVGFGSTEGGSNLVVQLMTEERRGDIDLEKLWTGILNRARREQESTASERQPSVETNGEDNILKQELDGPRIASSVGTVQRDLNAAAG